MSLTHDLKALIHPHYIVNFILCISFIFFKMTKPFCSILFPQEGCELDMRETNILFMLFVFVMVKARKSGSMTMLAYLSQLFLYTKFANLMLWGYHDPRMALIFGVLFLLQVILLPEPVYSGPQNILYFHGSALEDELRKQSITWIVCFFAMWNPACVNMSSVFAELSNTYSLDNLKFGKVDVTRNPDITKQFRVNDSTYSRELPTIILFRDGKELMRRPGVDQRGHVQKFYFTQDNIKAAFDLNNLYSDCKKKLKDKTRLNDNHEKKE